MGQPAQPVKHPWQGAIPATGVSALVRIPIPGTANLVLSVRPPAGFRGSTCTLFFMEKGSKFKGLRLDYGQNKATGRVDYHWNIEGKPARAVFPGITNHMQAGDTGMYVYQGARAFRYLGTTLVVIGFAADAISIVQASNPLRRSTEVVSAWALAWAGARTGGMVGARVGALGGSMVEPGGGTAVGIVVVGFLGAAAGGYAGYRLGERAGGEVHDWATDTRFLPLPPDTVPFEALKNDP